MQKSCMQPGSHFGDENEKCRMGGGCKTGKNHIVLVVGVTFFPMNYVNNIDFLPSFQIIEYPGWYGSDIIVGIFSQHDCRIGHHIPSPIIH